MKRVAVSDEYARIPSARKLNERVLPDTCAGSGYQGRGRMMIVLLIVGIVLLVGAGVALWNRRTYSERMNLIRRAVPASAGNLSDAFPGEIVSINGDAHPEQPLTSEQSETPCIYYDFEIIRRYERSRRGGVSVGGGRRRRRGRSRGRETVAQNEQWVPFRVNDGQGEVRVNPDGAWFEARQVMNRYEHEGSNNLFGIPGLDININFGGEQTLGYEIKENAIPAESPVYVAGPVSEHGEIARNNHHGLIVSYRSESALRDDWGKRERYQLIGGIVAAGLGALFLLGAAVTWLISLI